MERKWWKEAVVYQIYPRSFCDSNGDGIGDLQGIISKLDYIKSIGVDVVWLSPVYKSPNDDNGYDISDYRDIMDEFGTLKDWEVLLEEMHKRDLKLIMDLVVNHTSDEHEWFVESRASKDNDKRDYYIWKEGKNGKEPNNWGSFFSPSAWEYDDITGEYYLHLFSKKQPDLNWRNPEVKAEIFDMIKWWLDKGIDGFRMDVINLICKDPNFPDSTKPPTTKDGYVHDVEIYTVPSDVHEILHELNKDILSKYDIMTVGETPCVTPETAALFVAEERQELSMVFQFELMDIDAGPNNKWEIAPWKLTEFKRIMNRWQIGLNGKGWNSLYLNNHDQPRMVSRFGDDTKYRLESAKMLATMLHTMQGTPYVYQGEEIGMTNVKFDSIQDYLDIDILNFYNEYVTKSGGDPKEALKSIHAKGRDNARTPLQWNGDANAGFTTGDPWIKVNPNYPQINAKQCEDDPNSILNYYRKLIRLRKDNLVLIYGDFKPLLEEDEEVYAYIRELDGEKMLVVLNFTGKDVDWKLEEYTKNSLLLSNYPESESLTLRPYESRVYSIS